MAPMMTLSFPDATGHIFTASDTVQGHVDFRMETDPKSGKTKFDAIHAKLRCVLVSHYHHDRPPRAGEKPGERHVDIRTETVQLYGEDKVLWSASSFYPSPPSRQALQPSTIRLPWSFVLPPPHMNLPGSFEGGSRTGKATGNQVGRIVFSIKITAHAPGMFSFNERLQSPFIYHPPSLVHPQQVPMALVPRGAALHPQPPRAPTVQEGWGTLTAEKEYKEGLFGKKNVAVVRTSPSDVIMPPLSDLTLTLVRHVAARAHGASDTFRQVVGPAIDVKNESRVWKVAPGMRELGGGERRMGGETVVVGEMVLGGDAGPTFGGTGTRGLLTCDYSISLDLELKGPMNDLEVKRFMSPVICSNVHLGQQQYWHQQNHHQQQQQQQQSYGQQGQGYQQKADIPAGYWDMAGDFGDEAK